MGILLEFCALRRYLGIWMGYSPAAWLARRNRAWERGFLKPKLMEGHSIVMVRTELADNLRKMAKSLASHADNQVLAGREFHAARNSTLAVKQQLGATETSRQLKLHQEANRAKHQPGKFSLNANAQPFVPGAAEWEAKKNDIIQKKGIDKAVGTDSVADDTVQHLLAQLEAETDKLRSAGGWLQIHLAAQGAQAQKLLDAMEAQVTMAANKDPLAKGTPFKKERDKDHCERSKEPVLEGTEEAESDEECMVGSGAPASDLRAERNPFKAKEVNEENTAKSNKGTNKNKNKGAPNELDDAKLQKQHANTGAIQIFLAFER